jgi:hypothetical protein
MKQLIALLTLFSVFSVFSQNCGNCTSTYSSSATINLNVLVGETFCIDAGVTITGDEPESHGFVTYHVEQVPGLTPGMHIMNHADIYFDFNDPIITNETWHTIYEGFPAVASINEFIQPTTNILIFPNPTNETITIKQDDMIIRDYIIYDIQGKMIISGTLSEKMTHVSMIKCSKGIYLIKIEGIAEPIRIVRN